MTKVVQVPNPGTNEAIMFNADLSQHPEKIKEISEDKEVTVGDIHGNSMKMIFMLIHEGVLQLENKYDYAELTKIYEKKVEELTRADIEKFESIIAKTKINQKPGIVRFLGDDLFDRGKNDYFVLKIFERLQQLDIHFEVNVSDHGMEFLRAFDQKFTKSSRNLEGPITSSSALSYDNCKRLIDRGIIEAEQLNAVVRNVYKPNLKLINYSIKRGENGVKDKINVYSHAPVGLESIKAAAEYYGIEYKEATVEELKQTIDAINKAFALEVELGTVWNHFEKDQCGARIMDQLTGPVSTNHPIIRIFWNRALGENLKTESKIIKTAAPNGAYDLSFGHGHDASTKLSVQEILYNKTQEYLSNKHNFDIQNSTFRKELKEWFKGNSFTLQNYQQGLEAIFKALTAEGKNFLKSDAALEPDFSDFLQVTGLPDVSSDQVPEPKAFPVNNFLYRYEKAPADKKPLISFADNVENFDNESGKANLEGEYHTVVSDKGEVAPSSEVPLAKFRRLEKLIPALTAASLPSADANAEKTAAFKTFTDDFLQRLTTGYLAAYQNFTQIDSDFEQWANNKENVEAKLAILNPYLSVLNEELAKKPSSFDSDPERKTQYETIRAHIESLQNRMSAIDSYVSTVNQMWGQFENSFKTDDLLSGKINKGKSEKQEKIQYALKRLKPQRFALAGNILSTADITKDKLFETWMNAQEGQNDSLAKVLQTKRAFGAGTQSSSTQSFKKAQQMLGEASGNQFTADFTAKTQSIIQAQSLRDERKTDVQGANQTWLTIERFNTNLENQIATSQTNPLNWSTPETSAKNIEDMLKQLHALQPMAGVPNSGFTMQNYKDMERSLNTAKTRLEARMADVQQIEILFNKFNDFINAIEFKGSTTTTKKDNLVQALERLKNNKIEVLRELLQKDPPETLTEKTIFNKFLEYKDGNDTSLAEVLQMTREVKFGPFTFGMSKDSIFGKGKASAENTSSYRATRQWIAAQSDAPIAFTEKGLKTVGNPVAPVQPRH